MPQITASCSFIGDISCVATQKNSKFKTDKQWTFIPYIRHVHLCNACLSDFSLCLKLPAELLANPQCDSHHVSKVTKIIENYIWMRSSTSKASYVCKIADFVTLQGMPQLSYDLSQRAQVSDWQLLNFEGWCFWSQWVVRALVRIHKCLYRWWHQI